MVVIGLLLLVVFGPGKLPGMARDFGRFASEARRSVEEFKKDLVSEGEGGGESRKGGGPKSTGSWRRAFGPKRTKRSPEARSVPTNAGNSRDAALGIATLEPPLFPFMPLFTRVRGRAILRSYAP